MLRLLSIRNFVVVESLDVEFAPGFSALTGETGAGKSILLDALSLLLGDRFELRQLRPGAQRAELAAEFDVSDAPGVAAWLAEQGIAADDDDVLLRRLFDAQGKSRAWINGSAATLAQLKALGERLVGTKLRFLETPVSGTSEQVRVGDGVGLIGGDPKTADDAKAVLDALFPRRFHIGKAGDGGRAKLAVNLILGLNRMALAEGLTFAERMGLDPKAFLEVAKGAASYSQVMETKGEKMRSRDFAPEGRVKQTLKDVHMMLEQGEKLGQELPMLKVHCDVLEACVRAGEAERDNSIIVEEIRRRRKS